MNRPHVVILGAGASKQAFSSGDRNGSIVPVMNELVEATNIHRVLTHAKIDYAGRDFEALYSELHERDPHGRIVRYIEWALKDCGFDREGRAFHPHLTLGKADASSRAGEFRGLDEAAANLTYKGELKIRKMDLMRSQVVKGKATYSVRHRSAFAG